MTRDTKFDCKQILLNIEYIIFKNQYMKKTMSKKDIGVSQYQKMKPGEYQLHVLVQATCGLSLQSDDDLDAMISLHAFGQTQYSKVKKNVGFQETFWGQHFYFSRTFDANYPIQGQRLMFSVWDHNKLLQDSLVGRYQVDIQRIYSQKEHCIEHMWLALSNMEKDFNQITGYIKVSMSVLGEGDTNVELSVQPLSSLTKEKKVLMPPNVQRKTYQLIVDIYNGKHIKPQDGKTVDSYIGVQFGQIYTITEPAMETVTPTYGTRVYLPLALPAVTDNIVVRINDFNFIQKSEVIGSHYININKILKKEGISGKEVGQSHIRPEKKLRTTDLQWINFYGPQVETSNDEQKNVHQFFPQLATYYVGSVLMRISIKEDTDPDRRSEKMQKLEMKIEKKPLVFYNITAKITAALNLFEKNKKYKIVVRVGSDEMSTDYAKCKNGFCLWANEKVFTVTIEQNQLVPDIFVYLVDERNKKVCYSRYHAKEGLILEDKWINLKPDLSIVKLQNEEAGYLKLGLSMERAQRHGQVVSKKIVTPLSRIYENDRRNGKIVIELISAESLLPLDEDGSADPYFIFSYMHAEGTSSKKEDTLNPIYFEKLVLNAEVVDEEGCPPIIVNAYDQDKMSRDFIGTAFIDVGDGLKNKSVVYGDSTRPRPKWYDLTQNGIVSGRFLVSIILLPNYSRSIPPQINIAKAKYELRLFVLGLRGMKSTGVISVKKPFIEFDYENLNLFSSNKTINQSKNVVTEPKESGNSINIQVINKTTIMLPQNSNYWPSLSAKVKDYILGGIYEPTLGYFAINLQQAFEKSINFRKQYLELNKFTTKKKKVVKKSSKLEGINEKVLMNLRNFIMKSINYCWKVNSPKVKLNKIRENNDKLDRSAIVIFPNYVLEGKQNHKPGRYVEKYKERIIQNGQYMQIGYDNKEIRRQPLDKRNKHYRYCLDTSYEDYYQRIYNTKLGVCGQINIRKGRVFPANDTASSVVRKVSTEDTYVGIFKGDCFISQVAEKKTHEEEEYQKKVLQVFQKLANPVKVYMYLYVLQAANLPPRDEFSHSDPYLIITAGDKKLDLEDEYFDDETNPQFFRKIKMLLQLPLDSIVEIQVWDHDPVKPDELIGSTILDIQNRFFAQYGSLSTNNPIETHNLMAKQSKLAQGLIRFWVDLVPLNQVSLYREFNIGKKAESMYEVRIIVWGCKNMPNNDIEDMNDLYIVCMFNDEEQETDVHYRSATGTGCFNWRTVFSVELPLKNPLVTFKVYDKDLLSGNDYISSGSFSIAKYLDDVFETDLSTKLYLGTQDLSEDSDTVTGRYRVVEGNKMYDRFEVPMRNKLQKDDDDGEKVGTVQISIEILTQKDAKNRPAGKGRDAPNQHPHLPQPSGRFEWSLNPIKMLGQLCGKGFKAKIALALCCFLFLGFIVYFGASFGGSIIGGAIGG